MEQHIARWNQLRARVEAKARRCAMDPEFAARENLKPKQQIPVAGGFAAVRDQKDQGDPPMAGFLRAIATKEIPKEFKWEVVTVIGGRAFLALVDHDPPLDAA